MCLSLETLTSIIRTASPILVELIDLVNSIIIFLSQMTLLGWLTFLLGFLSLILTVCSFGFIPSDASICSTMAVPPLGNSDHVVVSVSIGFPINLKRDASFHRIAYDYSRADWGGLRDHLREVPWEDMFKLKASATTGEFCVWVLVGIDVYILHHKYHVKPHSPPWFSAACPGAIVHRNHFLHLYQQNKYESTVKFR